MSTRRDSPTSSLHPPLALSTVIGATRTLRRLYRRQKFRSRLLSQALPLSWAWRSRRIPKPTVPINHQVCLLLLSVKEQARARSQSQPKVAIKVGYLSSSSPMSLTGSFVVHNAPESSTISSANKLVAKTPLLALLEPSRTPLPRHRLQTRVPPCPRGPPSPPLPLLRIPGTVTACSTFGTENAALKESCIPKPKTLKENSLVRATSEGRVKKPVDPRKPPPMLTPRKKRKAPEIDLSRSPALPNEHWRTHPA